MTHDNSEALFGVRLWGVTIVVRQGEESRDDAFFPHSVRLKNTKNSGFFFQTSSNGGFLDSTKNGEGICFRIKKESLTKAQRIG